MVETEDLEIAGFNVPKSVRIDAEMDKEIRKIALFSKKRPGTWMQDLLYEKIHVMNRSAE